MDIYQLAMDLIAILAILLVTLVMEYLRRRLGTEQLQKIQAELAAKQDLAMAAVLFAQQAYEQLGGPEKYQVASEWLASEAQKRGLNLTAEEVRGLIEAAVKVAKLEFGQQWKELQAGT